MIDAITVSTPELGDRSYVVHDGSVGVAVDPQRDVDRLLEAATAAGVRIVCVAETHLHNDYVSGGWALAHRLGVPYLVAAAEDVAFDRRPVGDGDLIELGRHFSLRVLATPGHTVHHLSYLALDRGRPALACTGGSLLYGSVGRTDLAGPDWTDLLAGQQFRSAHRLGQLPGWVDVLPTHGFGSFCSVSPAIVSTSTIEQERRTNLAFRVGDESRFVSTLVAQFTDVPRYYHRMAGRNRLGARAPDLTPPPALDGCQVARMVDDGAWVVDLRGRGAFAAGHLAGSINVELDTPFTTYLGWLLPDDTPVVLLAETAKAIATAQVDLARIGIDSVAGQLVGPLPPPVDGRATGRYPVRGFADLTRAAGQANVALDVRRLDEWRAGHLDRAVHVPLHELGAHLDRLPPGTLWVHCAAGYRAAIAASLLARAGREVVLVDGRFDPPPG